MTTDLDYENRQARLQNSTTKSVPNSKYALSKDIGERDGSNAPIFGIAISFAAEQWSFDNGSRGGVILRHLR